MPEKWKRALLAGWLIALLLTISGCRPSTGGPENVALSDPKIKPLLQALEQVDRNALGFTPIATNSQITLELNSSSNNPARYEYDAELAIYGPTSRSIAFRKSETGYRWIAEQESWMGPKWYQTIDGTFRESLVIEYQIEPVNGIPTNQLHIQYIGSDTNLTHKELTLAEARPILEKWKTASVEPQPPDLENGPDPGLFLLVLFMLCAFIAVCILALIVGTILIVVGAGLVIAGVLSAALLIGLLRRSASAGFRALFLQLGALAGIIFGAVVTAVFIMITKVPWNSPPRWVAGILLGLLIGTLLAWLFNKVWTRIAQELTRRLEKVN